LQLYSDTNSINEHVCYRGVVGQTFNECMQFGAGARWLIFDKKYMACFGEMLTGFLGSPKTIFYKPD